MNHGNNAFPARKRGRCRCLIVCSGEKLHGFKLISTQNLLGLVPCRRIGENSGGALSFGDRSDRNQGYYGCARHSQSLEERKPRSLRKFPRCSSPLKLVQCDNVAENVLYEVYRSNYCRNHPPRPKDDVQRLEFPEVLVDATLAEVSHCRVRLSPEKHPDVSIESDELRHAHLAALWATLHRHCPGLHEGLSSLCGFYNVLYHATPYHVSSEEPPSWSKHRQTLL